MKRTLLNWLQENEPNLYKDMRETQHGYKGVIPNPYHLEGDILTHTEMVLDIAVKAEDINIMLTALLHDIGKVAAAFDNHEANRRNFKQHEAISTFMAVDILDKFLYTTGIEFSKTRVLMLIAIHGRLYNYFGDDGISKKHVMTIKDMFRNDVSLFDDFIKFFICDHTGRITKETTKTDTLPILYQIRDEIEPEEKKLNKTLYIMIGLPRSGKSTYTQTLLNDSVVVSRDALIEEFGTGKTYSEKWKSLSEEQQKEIDKVLQERFNAACKSGKNVVIDMTNMGKKSRKKWLNSSLTKDFKKVAKVCLRSVETCYSRNTDEKFIPKSVLESMSKNFVMPLYDEVDEIHFI